MGNFPCCDSRSKDTTDVVLQVKLVMLDNNEPKIFDRISLATTPRSRHNGYNNRVPQNDECLLLPSSTLPSRLRTVYSQRSCTPLTILFCEKLETKCQTTNSSTLKTFVYRVQEQMDVTPHDIDTTFTPSEDGDLIMQCGPLAERVFEVHVTSTSI